MKTLFKMKSDAKIIIKELRELNESLINTIDDYQDIIFEQKDVINNLEEVIECKTEEVKAEKPVDVEAVKAFLATDFESIYETLTKEDRRTLWRSVIDEIVLDGHLLISVLWHIRFQFTEKIKHI